MNRSPGSMTSNLVEKKYYGEVLDSIPFSMTVDLMKRMMPTPLALGVAGFFRLRHWLGFPLKPRHAFGGLETCTDMPAEQMPPRPMSRWAAQIERLGDLGFRPLAFSVPDLIGAKESALAVFLDEPGATFALLEWQRLEGAGKIEEQTPMEFNSYLADGSEVMTGMIAEEHLVLAGAFQMDFLDQLFLADNLSIRRCYEKHLQRIDGREPLHFLPENGKREHDQHALRRFNCLMDLGVIRELTPKEIAYAKQQRLPVG